MRSGKLAEMLSAEILGIVVRLVRYVQVKMDKLKVELLAVRSAFETSNNFFTKNLIAPSNKY